MATLATIIGRLPKVFQQRYSTEFVDWINDLLEELGDEGFFLPEIDFECGAVVNNDVWVTKPSGMKDLKEVFDPAYFDKKYGWTESNGKIKLTDTVFDDDAETESVTAFSNYNVAHVDVNISDAAEGDYEKFLLVITGGTWTGKTFVIHKNDASAGGVCRLYFEHELSTVMSGTLVTAGYLTGPGNYVMLRYSGSFDAVADANTEVPIDDKFERRVTYSYLYYRCYAAALSTSNEATKAQKDYDDVIKKMKGVIRGGISRIPPRYSPGFDQMKSTYSEIAGRTPI